MELPKSTFSPVKTLLEDARVEAVADEVELDDLFETECQLLDVACTHACGVPLGI
jgi:hypothetical protein